MIHPKQQLAYFALPQNRLTVALHIRTGIGYDLNVNIRNMPTKFPSLAFYLNGIKQIVEIFPNTPLYVHIFTDHPDTFKLKKQVEDEMAIWDINTDIILGIREQGNHHSQNVLEDLFMMTKFDCLVHPDSSVSRMAVLLSGPIVEIKPFNWGVFRKNVDGIPVLDINGDLIVDPILVFRPDKGENVSHRKAIPIPEKYLFLK